MFDLVELNKSRESENSEESEDDSTELCSLSETKPKELNVLCASLQTFSFFLRSLIVTSLTWPHLLLPLLSTFSEISVVSVLTGPACRSSPAAVCSWRYLLSAFLPPE